MGSPMYLSEQAGTSPPDSGGAAACPRPRDIHTAVPVARRLPHVIILVPNQLLWGVAWDMKLGGRRLG